MPSKPVRKGYSVGLKSFDYLTPSLSRGLFVCPRSIFAVL